RRLVARELGPDLARRSVWLLALWPGSVFFSAPYSESVFLLCTLGAFVAAREGRWALAGIACALASSSRLVGLVVVVPVALMYLYGPRADAEPRAARGMRPRFPLRRDAGWLALAPLGLVAFSAYLARRVGDPLAWSYAQARYWKRVDDAPPLVLWRALKEAWHSLGTLRGTLDGHVPTGAAYQIGNALALTSLLELGVLAVVLVAAVGCLRRLPLPYGAYVLVSLVVILSSRVDDSGTVVLQAMHRYVAVLFPVFVWLALATAKRERWTPVLAAFGTGLGLLTAQFAASYWLN
ncbi:MAG: hypothetical protein QOE28_1155, partial [Solirubrobacteraceae bacterium]|nr:hypothetical protein [Solirubrobacteraceae bacterium]